MKIKMCQSNPVQNKRDWKGEEEKLEKAPASPRSGDSSGSSPKPPPPRLPPSPLCLAAAGASWRVARTARGEGGGEAFQPAPAASLARSRGQHASAALARLARLVRGSRGRVAWVVWALFSGGSCDSGGSGPIDLDLALPRRSALGGGGPCRLGSAWALGGCKVGEAFVARCDASTGLRGWPGWRWWGPSIVWWDGGSNQWPGQAQVGGDGSGALGGSWLRWPWVPEPTAAAGFSSSAQKSGAHG